MKPRPADDLDAATWAAIAAVAGQAPVKARPREPQAAMPDWRRAMLDEARAGDDVRGRIAGRQRPEPLPDLTPPSAPAGFIAPVVDRKTIPARPAPLSAGERLELIPVPPHPPLPAGVKPGVKPADLEAYTELMLWLYRPPTQALKRALRHEPVFGYASRRWRLDPGSEAGNLELLNVVYDRLSALMGSYYDFDPAPLIQVFQRDTKWIGMYLPGPDAIIASSRLLASSFDEVVNTIAHEQIHALQWGRVAQNPAGLGSHDQAMRTWWASEIPRMNTIPYRSRGIEVHAFAVGDALGEVCQGL